MKLTVKIAAILILAVLAWPVFMLPGCGDVVNGGQCGGCPDSALPDGGSLAVVTALESRPIGPTDSYCSSVTFIAKGENGDPMNDVCVEISPGATNATIGLHDPSDVTGSCSQAGYSYIRTRTDNYGRVTIDLFVESPCSDLESGTSSASYSVRAVSCGASKESSASVTIDPACGS